MHERLGGSKTHISIKKTVNSFKKTRKINSLFQKTLHALWKRRSSFKKLSKKQPLFQKTPHRVKREAFFLEKKTWKNITKFVLNIPIVYHLQFWRKYTIFWKYSDTHFLYSFSRKVESNQNLINKTIAKEHLLFFQYVLPSKIGK